MKKPIVLRRWQDKNDLHQKTLMNLLLPGKDCWIIFSISYTIFWRIWKSLSDMPCSFAASINVKLRAVTCAGEGGGRARSSFSSCFSWRILWVMMKVLLLCFKVLLCCFEMHIFTSFYHVLRSQMPTGGGSMEGYARNSWITSSLCFSFVCKDLVWEWPEAQTLGQRFIDQDQAKIPVLSVLFM